VIGRENAAFHFAVVSVSFRCRGSFHLRDVPHKRCLKRKSWRSRERRQARQAQRTSEKSKIKTVWTQLQNVLTARDRWIMDGDLGAHDAPAARLARADKGGAPDTDG
jgi:hypothetical protein